MSIAAGIALAHLLTPGQFGLAGMAVVFSGLGALFGDLALSASLIQRPTLREEDRSTAFWTNLAAGLVLTGAGIAAAPLVAGFFGRPAVGPLFAASSTLFILWALSGTQTALLTRDMSFRSLELRTIAASLAGAVGALALAVAGAGAFSIVGELIISAAVSLVLLWALSPWRPRFVYSFESLRALGSFGGKTFLSQLLGYLTGNLDNLLVGRFLGSVALGVYSVAYTTMFLPIARIAQPISQVMFSALARMQHEPVRLRETLLRGNQLVAAVNVPVFLGLAVVAPDFVPVVLGRRWHEAVPVLQLLSLAGAADSLQSLNWAAVQALGKAGVNLRLRLLDASATIAAFGFGLRWGVVGVAGLFAAARGVLLIVNTAVTCRTIGCSISRAARAGALVATLALLMAVGVYVARLGLVHAQIPGPARLVALVALGAVVYGGLAVWRARTLAREALAFMLGRQVRDRAGLTG